MDLPIILKNESGYKKKINPKKEIEDSYLIELKKAFKEYQNELKEDANLNQIKKICKDIEDAYILWCSGDCMKALNKLKRVLIKAIKRNNLKIELSDFIHQENRKCYLYKARISDPNDISLNAEDMLHIPLSKRYLVQNQRFSIAGCPCVYMALSSYVCWIELGRPNFNSFYVSAIDVKKDKKIQLLNLYDDGTKYKENREFIFPLIIATSFKNYDNNRSFKPEYVISSMIMTLLSEIECDGIMYTSNCMNHSHNMENLNIAIPVKTDMLKDNFIVGEPCSFQAYEILPSALTQSVSVYNGRDVEINKKRVPLYNLEFGLFDQYLAKELEKKQKSNTDK